MRIAIATLGCKANQYDSEVIRESFEGAHYLVVPHSERADCYIVNTCTVTGKTDYQSRQLIRKIHRLRPEAKIVVTGCYAQVAPDELKKIPGVSLVLGNVDKDHLVDTVFSSILADHQTRIASSDEPESSRGKKPAIRSSAKTRFFLKIQDGCNSRCSYCIIPYARGGSRSMPPAQALSRLSHIGAAGYKEAVLTGIHLGAYGLDLSPPTSLLDLLQEVDKTRPLDRVRLSSIEPNEINDPFLEFVRFSERVCPHFHLPLQSGSDKILQRMSRPYSAARFERVVMSLTAAMPDVAIGADVIAGFPGEGDEEFDETYQLIKRLPIAYLHVFPFSPRKGTPAATFSHRVPGHITKKRARSLRQLSSEKREQFYSRFVHKTLPVLIETKRDRESRLLKGFTRNYVPVLVDGGDELMNNEVPVSILSVHGGVVRGNLVRD